MNRIKALNYALYVAGFMAIAILLNLAVDMAFAQVDGNGTGVGVGTGIDDALKNVDEQTLTTIVVGGIFGALFRNFLGYRDEKRKNPKAKYAIEELVLTSIFAVPVGTLAGLTLPIVFSGVTVAGSGIKAFVLIMVVMAMTAGIDQFKSYTVARKKLTETPA